jgi:Holliday junction resolvase RusA-like endonuclease
MRAHFTSNVDPKRLRINIRYRDARKLSPDTLKAYHQVIEDVEKAVEREGIRFHPKARLELEMVFTMSDRRADLDGPAKRAQDAVSAGLGINDQRFDRITLIREVGEPSIRAIVSTLDNHEPEERPPLGTAAWAIFPGESQAVYREDT